MTVKSSMESYAARLASFNAVYPSTKKRASDAKGSKTLKWPHRSPSPPQLARAGFFYKPTSSCPDNATCYLCQSNLDGWEEDDDAVEEHLKHAPYCGWAITVAIEQDIEGGSYSLEDPMSEKVLNARQMTFGSNWPHENKRGWICKTQKMIEAGWHYCPTLESDDFVKCSYCSLGLDGWEPKDKPYEEHQRRSPDCAFFTLYSSIKAKDGRSKKTRTSKMSRLSTQSNITAVSEDPSTMETHLEEPLISTTDSAKPAKAQRGKKTAKAKKNAGTAKGRGIKAAHEESQIASSFLEPEDDDFEIKVAPSPVQGTGSRKRKSGESDIVDDDQAGNVDTQSQVPTKKQRRTRASSSAQKAQEIPIATRVEEDEDEAEADVQMTDAEEMPPPTLPASKKRGRAGKKRASSTTRKASSASIASKASLRANVPNDEEIETALEADLDRPLTDEEAETEPLDTERSKDGRLTRTKLGSKKATASVAPTRRGTRASSAIPIEPVENLYPSIPSLPDDESESTDKPIVNDSQAVVAERSPKIKEQNVETSPAGSSQKPIQDEDIEMSQELVATEENVQESVKSTRAQPTRNRQISRQLPTRNTRAPALPAANDNTQQSLDINSSILETQTVQDDSGHETDASVVKPGRTKRGGKQATATGKKAKGGKKVVPKNQITEVVVPAPATDTQTALSTDQTFDVVSVGPEPTEPNATTPVLSEEPAEGTKITTPPKKMKGKAGKNKTAEQKASIAASPEQSDIVVELQEAPPSVPSPSIHSTPQHVLSPQSSDAENQPPSSRPSSVRPPLSFQSPLKSQMTRVPIAITPSNSPSKGGFSKLQSTYPWTMVDLEHVFQGTPSADKENDPSIFGSPTGEGKGTLASPEKKMTVEEWIHFNAQRGENRLRGECERLVGKFEGEGVRALRTLEGIACAQ